MSELEYVSVLIKADVSRFTVALHNLTLEMYKAAQRLSEFARNIIEDVMVDSYGIARSDIKDVVWDGNNWVAHLYNGRKIKYEEKGS